MEPPADVAAAPAAAAIVEEPAEAQQESAAARELAPGAAAAADAFTPEPAAAVPPAASVRAPEPASVQRPEAAAAAEREAMPEDGAAEGADEAEASVAVADGAAAVPAGASAPRKQVQRVVRTWTAEDVSQMSVAEGDFVDVWLDTSTEHGWIHAEKTSDGGQVGWLPACVLHQLPDNQRWMRARQQWEAMDESQCSVEEGAHIIVWLNSRTQEGWTYVEAEKDSTMRPGWLPAFCLEWGEA